MRWVVCGLGVLVACSRPPAPETRSGLKVTLPEGWRAVNTTAGALRVGPVGRGALELEPASRPLPHVEELVEAVQSEGGRVLSDRSTTGLVLVRYEVGPGGEQAFLGVREAGARTVWCASLKGASLAELDAGERVCSLVTLTGP